MTTRTLLLLAMLLASTPAWADTILLKDGRSYAGTVIRKADQVSIKTADGKIIPIAPDSIARLTLESDLTPADVASNDWARTQAQVRQSTNLAEIVALLNTFVNQHPDSPVTTSAAQSLADFQKMKDGNYVKLRDRWMSRDQAEVMTRRANDKAREALALYTSSRLKEAVAASQVCLEIDDQNSTALTVLGLASFKLNKVPDSIMYFTKLTEADPNNAMGWNNLAVVQYLAHKQTDALGSYTRALQAAMDNRMILDNIADAIANYPGGKDSLVLRGLKRIADQSELRVAAVMAQKGLFRYRSTWITQEQRDRINAVTGNFATQLTQTQVQYNAAQAALTSLDLAIRRVQEAIQQANTSYATANNYIAYNQARNLYVDPYYVTVRDAAFTDAQRASQQRQSMEDQRGQIIEAMRKLKLEIDRLTPLVNDPNHPNADGAQRLMEPGDLENPPPPTPVEAPPKPEAKRIPSADEIQKLYPPLQSTLASQTTTSTPQNVPIGPNTNVIIAPGTDSNGIIVMPGATTIIRH